MKIISFLGLITFHIISRNIHRFLLSSSRSSLYFTQRKIKDELQTEEAPKAEQEGTQSEEEEEAESEQEEEDELSEEEEDDEYLSEDEDEEEEEEEEAESEEVTEDDQSERESIADEVRLYILSDGLPEIQQWMISLWCSTQCDCAIIYLEEIHVGNTFNKIICSFSVQFQYIYAAALHFPYIYYTISSVAFSNDNIFHAHVCAVINEV